MSNKNQSRSMYNKMGLRVDITNNTIHIIKNVFTVFKCTLLYHSS